MTHVLCVMQVGSLCQAKIFPSALKQNILSVAILAVQFNLNPEQQAFLTTMSKLLTACNGSANKAVNT